MSSEIAWKLQVVPPRDFFGNCTLTIEQWLANDEADGPLGTRTGKWNAFMEACALARPGVVHEDGLRHEPRVGFDPIADQTYFIFKASNNGTTYVVSEQGIAFPPGEEFVPRRP